MGKSNIGIVLGVDKDKEFKAALSAAKKEVGNLKNDLALLSKEFEDNANSQEALRAKLEKLGQLQEAYNRRVNEAKAGLENAKRNYEESGQALENLQNRLQEATEKQRAMQEAGETSSEAYKALEREINELNTAISKQATEVSKAAGSQSDWQRELRSSESALREVNQEIDQTERYLREAEQATDGLAHSMDNMGDEVSEAAEETHKLNISLGDMIKNKAVDMMGDAIQEVGRKAVEAAKYIIDVGSSFEAQMSRVQAISGATGAELDKLSAKAKDMGRNTMFTATEAGQALEYMAMAGWKTDDMLEGLEGIMNLAAASGEDLATTSDIVTDALTALGLQAEDSSHFADVLAVASSNANTNVGMMGETFKYIAPVAGSLGYTAEDLAEQIGLAANAGIKASQAGTGLRSIITRLATDAGASSKSLGALGTLTQELGVQFYDAEGRARGLTDVINEAREAWKGLTDEEQQNYAKKIAGQNAITTWNALMNASAEDVAKLEEELRNADGAASRMANTMSDNLSGSMDRFHSAVDILGTTIYEGLSGSLKELVDGVTGAINDITDAITPQKTVLDEFIEDIKDANSAVRDEIDTVNAGLNGISADNLSLDGYFNSIEKITGAFGDLKDAKDNTFRIEDSYEIYEVDAAVKGLQGVLSDAAIEWDRNSGTIKVNTEELQKNLKEYQAFTKGKALVQALKNKSDTVNQSAENLIQAKRALEEAENEVNSLGPLEFFTNDTAHAHRSDANEALRQAQKTADEASESYAAYNQQIEELAESMNMTREEFEAWVEEQDAVRSAAEAEGGTIEDLNAVLEEEAETVGESTQSMEAHKKAVEDLAEAYNVSVGNVEKLAGAFTSTEAFDEWANAMTENAKTIREEYDRTFEAIDQGIGNALNGFNKLSEDTGLTVHDVYTNLSEGISSLYEWGQNMLVIGEAIGQGLVPASMQAMYDTLAETGPGQFDSLVAEMADMIRAGEYHLDGLAEEFSEAITAQANYDQAIMYWHSNGKALAASQAEGYLEGAAGLRTAVEETAVEIGQTAQTTGEETAVIMHDVGSRAGDEFQAGIYEKQSLMRQAAQESVTGAVDAVNEAVQGTGIDAGQQIADNTAQGVSQSAGAVADASRSMVDQGRQAAEQMTSDFYVTGQQLPQKLRDGIEVAKNWPLQSMRNLVAELVNAAGAQQQGFINAGNNMAVGLANGINSGASQAINAAINMAQNALNAANKTLDIHSPSGKFEQTGIYSGEGLALGFDKSGEDVISSIKALSDKMLKTMRDSLDLTQFADAGRLPDLTASIDSYFANAASLITANTTVPASEQRHTGTQSNTATQLETILLRILEKIPSAVYLGDAIVGELDNRFAVEYNHNAREVMV